MARTKISTYEKNLVDQIATSATECLSDGVAEDTNADGVDDTNLLTDLLPIADFNTAFPPGSSGRTKFEQGLKQSALPIIKHTAPVGWYAQVSPPSPGIITIPSGAVAEVAWLSVPPSEAPSTDRRMLITANLSGYASAPNQLVRFYVSYSNLSGSQNTDQRRFFFNESGSHRHMSGSWVVNVPARVSQFQLLVIGPFTYDFNDFFDLSVWG